MSTLLQASAERIAVLEMIALSPVYSINNATNALSEAVAGVSLSDRLSDSAIVTADIVSNAWSLVTM